MIQHKLNGLDVEGVVVHDQNIVAALSKEPGSLPQLILLLLALRLVEDLNLLADVWTELALLWRADEDRSLLSVVELIALL